MKNKIKWALCFLIISGMVFQVTVHATENDEITPMQIDKILEDVTPIEISEGVYLRDNGVYSMVEVDASQFEEQTVAEVKPEDGEILFDNFSEIMPCAWDLSTDYIGSFKAKFRVLTRSSFTGYDTIYAKYYDISCPSDSTWKGAIYINNKEQICSDWHDSNCTDLIVKFSKLDKSKYYNVAFEKTDNDSEATGVIKVYK